jgi:hypothetical protein
MPSTAHRPFRRGTNIFAEIFANLQTGIARPFDRKGALLHCHRGEK